MMFRFVLVLCGSFLWLNSLSFAEEQPTNAAAETQPGKKTAPAEAPREIVLTLEPASEPRPALRYRLQPGYLEQTPGNAVPFYYRAILMTTSQPKTVSDAFHALYDSAMDIPLAEFPSDKAAEVLKPYAAPLEQLRIAAMRETVDWDWRVKDLKGYDAVGFLLIEVQEARALARVLNLKARWEIAEGRYDEALNTLAIGFEFARDIAAPPLLINGLVGLSIASLMCDRIQDFIDAPGAPNLYWALAEFPRPFIDLQPALRHELTMPTQILPFLDAPETASRPADEWERLLALAIEDLKATEGADRPDATRDPAEVARKSAREQIENKLPVARRRLQDAGFTADRLDRMPAGQIVAIHQARLYQYAYQEMFKWTLLPYAQAYPRLQETEKRLRSEGFFEEEGSPEEILPVATLLMPAMGAAVSASMRFQSRFDALRALEALRMHLAAGDGTLPEALENVEAVPVPPNPQTGKPFPWTRDGERGVLDVPALPGRSTREAYRFVVEPAPAHE